MKTGKKAERRASKREDVEISVGIRISTEPFKGHTRNISREGIMVITDNRIKLSVDMNGKEWKGTLVRIQPIDKESWGLAVRFDSPLPIEEITD